MPYLDHHASHPLLPSVQRAISAALMRVGNASSVHLYAQRIRADIEDVREQLAAWVGLSDARVIFTSGATEANNLALHGHQGRVLASAIEHPSVLRCVAPENLLPVTAEGVVDLEALSARLGTLSAEAKPLVSVMYANNETGILQPIDRISRLVHQSGGLLHVDAVQALGRQNIDMRRQGIDMMSVSGHKIGAPSGLGALIAPKAVRMTPQILGGAQEYGLRAGTENLLGIVGLGAAMQWYSQHQADYIAHLQRLDTLLMEGLHDLDVQIVGRDQKRLDGCALLVCPNADAQSLLMQMDGVGIAVSSGSACSSGTVADSHVLRAMGMAENLRRSALRVSFGESTKTKDVQGFVNAYRRSVSR